MKVFAACFVIRVFETGAIGGEGFICLLRTPERFGF